MKSDLEIAQEVTLQPIALVAKNYGISEENLELYGKYKIIPKLLLCSGRKAEGKIDSGYRYKSYALGRGKDYGIYRLK